MAADKTLKKLHTSLIDAQSGYEEAIGDADHPQMKALFQRLLSLHEKSHAELHRLLAAEGEEIDDDGSFMGTVNKTVVSVRSAVTGLDPASLSGFIDGETRIIEKYDDAIGEHGGDAETLKVLTKQKDALVAMVSEMRRLQSNAKSSASAART